jgi:hypothetical protein
MRPNMKGKRQASPIARVQPLTIRGIHTFALEVPMTYPLGTSAAVVGFMVSVFNLVIWLRLGSIGGR